MDTNDPMLKFTPVERRYLESLDDDTRASFVNEEPSVVRGSLLMDRVAEVSSTRPYVTEEQLLSEVRAQLDEEDSRLILEEDGQRSRKEPTATDLEFGVIPEVDSAAREESLAKVAKFSAEAKQFQMESEDLMASTGITRAATDVLKQTVRSPIRAVIRGADYVKAAITGPAVTFMVNSVEELTGLDIMSPEQERALTTRMPREIEESFVSLGGHLKTTSAYGAALDELGTFAAGYAALTVAAPMLIPAQYLIRAEAGAGVLLSRSKVLKWTAGVLKNSIKGDIVASVFGNREMFTAEYVKAATGVDIREQPEAIQGTARFLENTAMSFAMSAAFGTMGKFYNAAVKRFGKDAAEGLMKDTADYLSNPSMFKEGATEAAWAEQVYAKRQRDLEIAFTSPSAARKIRQAENLDDVLSRVSAEEATEVATKETISPEAVIARQKEIEAARQARSKAREAEAQAKKLLEEVNKSNRETRRAKYLAAKEAMEAAEVAAKEAEDAAGLATMEARRKEVFDIRWRLWETAEEEAAARAAVETQVAEVVTKEVEPVVVAEVQEVVKKTTRKPKAKPAEAPKVTEEPPVATTKEVISKVKKTKADDILPLKSDTERVRAEYVSKYPEKQEARKASLLQEDAAAVKLGGGPIVVGGDNLDGDILQSLYEQVSKTKSKDWMSGVDAVAEDLGVPKDIVEAVATNLKELVPFGPKGGPKGSEVIDLWTRETTGRISDIFSAERDPAVKALRDAGIPATPIRRISNGPMYGSLIGLTPKDFKKMGAFAKAMYEGGKKVGFGAVTLPTVVALMDSIDGEADLSYEAYLSLFALGLGANAVGRHLTTAGAALPKAALDVYGAEIAKGTLEITALAKRITDPQTRGALLSSVSEEVLRGPIERGQHWISKALNELVPRDGILTNIHKIPQETWDKVFRSATTGTARGIPEVVNPKVFNDPTFLYEAVGTTLSHFIKKLPKVSSIEGSLNDVFTRWQSFTKDLNLTGNAIRFFETFGGTEVTVEKRVAVMMTLDSFERAIFEQMGNVLWNSKSTGIKASAEVSQALGALRMFRELCSDPASLLGSRSGEQGILATVLKQVSDEDMKYMGGVALDRMFRDTNNVAMHLRGLIDNKGIVHEGQRQVLYEYLEEIGSNPGLSKRASYGAYALMLSGLRMVKNAVMSNMIQSGLEVGAQKVAQGLHNLASDEVGVMAKKKWFEGFTAGLPGFARNVQQTLETGIKAIDPTGERPVYRQLSVYNAIRSMGGDRNVAGIFERGVTYLSEIFGADPITLAKAADAGHQSVFISAYSTEALYKAAVEYSSTNRVSIEAATEAIMGDPKLYGNVTADAIDKSRGLFGINPPKPYQVLQAGQAPETSLSMAGEAATGLSKTVANPIISAFQRFFNTEVNYHLSSWEYRPDVQALSAAFDATVGKGRGLVYNYLKHSGSMTPAAKEELGRQIREKGARVLVGTMFAGTIATALGAAGYSLISPIMGRHTKAKRLGATDEGGIKTTDGKVLDFGQSSNLRQLLTMVDAVNYLTNNDAPEDIDIDEGFVGGYALAYLVSAMTPESVHDLVKTANNYVNSPDKTQGSMIEALQKFADESFGILDPQLLRQLDSFTSGISKRRRSMFDPTAEREVAVDIYGNPKEAPQTGVIGSSSKLYDDKQSKLLAEAGFNVDREYPLSYAGKRIKNRELQKKFNRILGGYLKSPDFKSSIEDLENVPDLGMRKELIKEYFNNARGAALSDPELYQELEDLTK